MKKSAKRLHRLLYPALAAMICLSLTLSACSSSPNGPNSSNGSNGSKGPNPNEFTAGQYTIHYQVLTGEDRDIYKDSSDDFYVYDTTILFYQAEDADGDTNVFDVFSGIETHRLDVKADDVICVREGSVMVVYTREYGIICLLNANVPEGAAAITVLYE